MQSFEHTNTFLRSALARDPFCLGDLGPEDVLRIESEFPNLFTGTPRKTPENNVRRPATGSPYAAPLFQTKPTSLHAPPKAVHHASQLKMHTFEPCSRSRHSFQSQRHGTSTGHPTAAPKIKKAMSRVGTAAFAKPYFPKPQPTQNRYISGLKPVPSGQRDSSGLYLNKYTDELLISRRKLEEATLALKETQSQISQRLSQHSFGGSRRSNSTGPKRETTLLEITSITRSPPKLPTSNQPQSLRPRIQSTPRFDLELVPSRIIGRKGDSSPPLEIKQVKFKDVASSSSDILKSQARKLLSRAKQAPGFIRPIFSNPGILKSNPNKKVNSNVTTASTVDFSVPVDHGAGDRRMDNTENHRNSPGRNEISMDTPRSPCINGIDEETLPALCSSSPSETEFSEEMETPLWFSPMQISNTKISAEEICAQIADREQLERESTAKFEQLLFTRLLVSKYEQEGKFQKGDVSQNQIQNSRAHVWNQGDGLPESRSGKSVKPKNPPRTRRTKYPRERRPQPVELASEHKSILEQIAAELIRAEVLKCIHAEELNAKMDVGVGTTPLNSREESLKLSTISEEGMINITPELTPPGKEVQKKPLSTFDRQENYQNVKSLSLRTPELTPPRQYAPRLTTDNKKVLENSSRDELTDCSSISDFVFSDMVSIPAQKKISKRVNVLAQLPDIPTPSITPPMSKHESESEKDSIKSSNASPVKTPAASVSGSAVRFTLPFSDHQREKSPSAHSSVSRSRSVSKIPRRTNSRSRQESLDSKSMYSIPDSASAPDTPSSGVTGLASSVSDGEFLGVPYKSPGEVSWSLSLSPGIYLGNEEDDSDNSSSDESQLHSDDFGRAEEPSEGEVRSRYDG